MKTFELQELMDWLEANPNREFNYYQPNDPCGCMLAQFFHEKSVSPELTCSITSPWKCNDKTMHPKNRHVPLAIIKGTENLSLSKIHAQMFEDASKVRGSQLLEGIKSELALVTPS